MQKKINAMLLTLCLIALSFYACSKGGKGTDGKEIDGKKVDQKLEQKANSKSMKIVPAKYDFNIRAEFKGKLELLGVNYTPRKVALGKTLTLSFYYRVLGKIEKDLSFFGFIEPDNGDQYQIKVAFELGQNKYQSSKWRVGEIIKDTVEIAIPPEFSGKRAVLWGGITDGEEIWMADKTEEMVTSKDGKIRIGKIPVLQKTDKKQKSIIVFQSKNGISIDGVLDEPAWKTASGTKLFVTQNDKNIAKPKTEAKLLWEGNYLIFGITCEDRTITGSSSKADSNMEKEDRIEIFIQSVVGGGSYYHLVVNSKGTLYDAFYKRRHSDTDLSWQSKAVIEVRYQGTFNRKSDIDKSWTLEIAVPFEQLATGSPLDEIGGSLFKINIFRVEKHPDIGDIVGMWNPTHFSDFHLLDRFVKVKLSDIFAEERRVNRDF